MPFPPQGGGVTPAQIWTYVARTLTGLTGQPRIDLQGEDADFEAGAGARKARIDAAISSRAVPGDAMDLIAARIANILSRAAPGDAMALTAAERLAVQALILSDATPFPGARIDTTISSRVSKAWFDQIIGDPTDPTINTTIKGFLLSLMAVTSYGGDAVMTGAPVIVVDVDASALAAYETPFMMEGLLDLASMQAGDTIVVREYEAVDPGPTYRLYATHTYTGVQAEPMLHFGKKIGGEGYRVTAQQTAGINRTLPYWFDQRRVK